MKKISQILFVIILCFISPSIYGGDVKEICEKHGVPVLNLERHATEANLRKISDGNFSRSKLGSYLKIVHLSHGDLSESKRVLLALEGNKKFIPDSKIKELSLRYSSKEQKLADPSGYRDAVISIYRKVLPTEQQIFLSDFLNLRDDLIGEVYLGPETSDGMNEVYGAESRLSLLPKGKYKTEIVFSNNSSEPIPYLIPLIAHELVHAKKYKDRIKIFQNRELTAEFLLVDEAIAFDLQLQMYTYLIKKFPDIFCAWLYPTWSYGGLVIPLSWAMSSLEEEFKTGKYLVNYASVGPYKEFPNLMNKSRNSLRSDLEKKIKKLNLKYLRQPKNH